MNAVGSKGVQYVESACRNNNLCSCSGWAWPDFGPCPYHATAIVVFADSAMIFFINNSTVDLDIK